MLDYAGGLFIAVPILAMFGYGLRLAMVGDGAHRFQAITFGIAMMGVSAGFAFWTVFGR